MRQIRTEIEIDAPVETVWSKLTDFEAYPEWNPFLQKISGAASVGTSLEVLIAPPGSRAMTVKPTVLAAQPNREFRWRGRVVIPGLFDGEHYFLLESTDSGRTRFVHGEIFTGILVLFFRGVINKAGVGFVQMNQALKELAERAAAD